jgi:predicted solute-binding protein
VREQPSTRVGCVQYLNARPLIHGWAGAVTLDTPSVLCAKLAAGELDVALVSSFEFLRNPVYRIVDGLSISSFGPVYSVVVAFRGAISEIKEIKLDPASETSVNLLRCLLAERGLNPRLIPGDASTEGEGARLLIGDQAIRFRQKHPDFGYWDLGQEWKDTFALPFVFALWLIRPEVPGARDIADRLRLVRDQNLARIEDVIADEKNFAPDFCRIYYRDYLRFEFGESEKQGLRMFARLCAKHGLLPKDEIELNVV